MVGRISEGLLPSILFYFFMSFRRVLLKEKTTHGLVNSVELPGADLLSRWPKSPLLVCFYLNGTVRTWRDEDIVRRGWFCRFYRLLAFPHLWLLGWFLNIEWVRGEKKGNETEMRNRVNRSSSLPAYSYGKETMSGARNSTIIIWVWYTRPEARLQLQKSSVSWW